MILLSVGEVNKLTETFTLSIQPWMISYSDTFTGSFSDFGVNMFYNMKKCNIEHNCYYKVIDVNLDEPYLHYLVKLQLYNDNYLTAIFYTSSELDIDSLVTYHFKYDNPILTNCIAQYSKEFNILNILFVHICLDWYSINFEFREHNKLGMIIVYSYTELDDSVEEIIVNNNNIIDTISIKQSYMSDTSYIQLLSPQLCQLGTIAPCADKIIDIINKYVTK